jgi:hypothetical protein
MKNTFLLYLFLIVSYFSFSQDIYYSDNTQISVLTCSSGDQLYSKFGHSAFRVKDFNKGYDVVYNYGVFDENQPLFYPNFAKGKMTYKLDKASFNYFYRVYQYENRTVTQQVLNLSSIERKKLIAFLENNAKPKNANYQYDFFYNNCATKIRSVLDTVFPNKISYNKNHITTNFTMRDLINSKISHNTWSNIGINIALGSVIDHKASFNEYQFLPEYIFKALNNSQFNNVPIVKETNILIEKDDSKTEKSSSFFLSPYFIFSLLSVVILLITYKDFKQQKISKTLDFILLFTTGLIGVFLLLLWFATNHTATANNYNILWGFAPNLIMAFLILKENHLKFKTVYFKFSTFSILILGIIWLIKIEAFAYGMLPIFIALFVRYAYLANYNKKQIIAL